MRSLRRRGPSPRVTAEPHGLRLQGTVDGVLLVDKPSGISSAEVVRRIKARVKPLKTGHLGTLDPFATGLLPILIGEGTKLAPFLETGVKEYTGTIALGVETDTLDVEGAPVRTSPVPNLDQTKVDTVADEFIGEIPQVPPVYSAIKREGVPLYKLARRGKPVEPAPARNVFVNELQLVVISPAALSFRAVCSPGTYIRSLARDIGKALGTAAHLQSLRRTRTAGFSIDQACSLDETLHALESGSVVDLIGMRQALAAMPEVEVGDDTAARIRNGDSEALADHGRASQSPFKVVCAERLVAIASQESGKASTLMRVFA